jgi:hypothetical protein
MNSGVLSHFNENSATGTPCDQAFTAVLTLLETSYPLGAYYDQYAG